MLRTLIEKLEKINISPIHVILVATAVGVARHLLELAVTGAQQELVIALFHTLDSVTFYATLMLCFLAGQKLFLNHTSYAPIAAGMALAILPPIIDIFMEKYPKYFYPLPDLFFLTKGITSGELFAVYGAIALFALYISASRKSAQFFFHAAFFAWATLQVFGSIHPMISFLAEHRIAGTTAGLLLIPTRLALITLPLAYLDSSFRRFISYRASRIFLFLALSLFSISVFALSAVTTLPLLVANVSAATIAYMLNSKGDEVEDKANLREVPQLSSFAWAVVLFIWISSLAFTFLTNPVPAALSPFAITAFAYAYSSPIKIKRHFPAAYVLEGTVFTLCFISYPMLTGIQLQSIVPQAAACFAVFTGGVMVKDYKDEPGDRKAKVNTIFTILQGKTKEIFWLAFRIMLVAVPPTFVIFEKGVFAPLAIGASAAFALGSAFILFAAKAGKEDVVDSYIWVFSGLLLISSFV